MIEEDASLESYRVVTTGRTWQSEKVFGELCITRPRPGHVSFSGAPVEGPYQVVEGVLLALLSDARQSASLMSNSSQSRTLWRTASIEASYDDWP